VKGEDWLRHEKVWIPFQLVHTRYTAAMRFDLNSFAATSTGLASGNHLLEAASHATCEVVERGPALRVWVVGHTDYVGTAEFNVTLSNARAAAVVKALAAAGIDPKRLTPHGDGPFAPVAANTTDEGRARNRRVELVAQP
jgi:outer membrane protein OmpA-like peptidoglycan-associated protein